MATVTTATGDRVTTGKKASGGKAPDRGTEMRGTSHKNYLGGLLSYVWLLIVLVFYFAWGRRHALLNDPEHRAAGPTLGEGH